MAGPKPIDVGARNATVFGLQIEATAGDGCALPKGARRELLVVARAPTREQAIEVARQTVEYHHWTDAMLMSTGEVVLSGEEIADPKVREVVEHARRHGAGILVFDKA